MLARRVAAHLGIFPGVLGSDGATNLTGRQKLDGLRSRFGTAEFDYIGNATPDLPLLARATEAMVANPSLALRLRLRSRGIRPAREFKERRHSAESMLRALRPHQWAKNLLIFLATAAVPLVGHEPPADRVAGFLLLFAHCLGHLHRQRSARYRNGPPSSAKAATALCLGRSLRLTGVGLAAAFLLLALPGARLLPVAFFGWLILYCCQTLAYSTCLKRIPLVDVLILSGLYTLRLLAGSAATGSYISHWLGGFSVFLFLSLAIAKRFAELENLRASGSVPKNGRGYLLADIDQLRSFGTSSAFASVVIFAIYISGSDVIKLYRQSALLWLIMPLMILWLCRVWLLASRGDAPRRSGGLRID